MRPRNQPPGSPSTNSTAPSSSYLSSVYKYFWKTPVATNSSKPQENIKISTPTSFSDNIQVVWDNVFPNSGWKSSKATIMPFQVTVKDSWGSHAVQTYTPLVSHDVFQANLNPSFSWFWVH